MRVISIAIDIDGWGRTIGLTSRSANSAQSEARAGARGETAVAGGTFVSTQA